MVRPRLGKVPRLKLSAALVTCSTAVAIWPTTPSFDDRPDTALLTSREVLSMPASVLRASCATAGSEASAGSSLVSTVTCRRLLNASRL
ncbi:hypothetical protein D3C71_2076270 [compost metagenome]